MIPAMLGRALFTFVCLIIGAGTLLPIYPRHVEAPGPVIAHPALLIADSVASECRDCAPGDADAIRCRLACACDRAQPPAAASHEASLSLTVHLIVGRSSERWWLVSKLPAI